MTIPQFQQFQLGDTIEQVRVTNIAESNGDSSCFVSLKDIQVYFPNAQTFKLDGVTIPFQEDSNGDRIEPYRVGYNPDKTIEVITDTPGPTKMIDRLANLPRHAEAILTKNLELHEYPIPRLFVIQPMDQTNWDPLTVLENKLRLYFLCECGEHNIKASESIQEHIHIANHEGYEIRNPVEFYRKYGKYIYILLQAFQTVDTRDGLVPVTHAPEALNRGVDHAIDYMNALFIENPILDSTNSADDIETFKGADLQQLEKFLHINDINKNLGNLYRITTDQGHVKWVCHDHYRSLYNEEEQKAFEDLVVVNGGKYEPHRGKVTISLGSRSRAKEFFDSLIQARHVYELDIDFDWDCNESDIDVFKGTLEKSKISILRLDLRSFQTGFGSALSSPLARHDKIAEITKVEILKTVHIALPHDLIKLSDLQSKESTHLHTLSYGITVRAMKKSAIPEFVKSLGTNAALTTVDLQNNLIGNEGAIAMAEVLKTTNTTLTTLNLSWCFIGNEGATAISEALKTNTTLTTLDMSRNSIGSDGAITLAEALKTNTTLTTLDLSRNTIGIEGAIAMTEALKTNATLTTLNLSNNSMEKSGAIAMSEAIKVNTTLIAFNLGHNSIGNEGAIALSEALQTNTTLITLSLWDNSIEKEGAVKISEALKTNATLGTLDLSRNKIGSDGAIVLSEGIKTNSTLSTLDLSDNLIGSEGADAISEALMTNTTLITLNLEHNSIRKEGAVKMSEALKRNTTLTTLHMSWNPIQKEGAIVISEALEANNTLTTLGMGGNSIGKEGTIAMSRALKTNTVLTTLNLGWNSIGKEGAVAMSETQKINPRLTITC